MLLKFLNCIIIQKVHTETLLLLSFLLLLLLLSLLLLLLFWLKN